MAHNNMIIWCSGHVLANASSTIINQTILFSLQSSSADFSHVKEIEHIHFVAKHYRIFFTHLDLTTRYNYAS